MERIVPDSISYSIRPQAGCCSRLQIFCTEVKDRKGRMFLVSEHNTRAGAEKKLAKLERALKC